MRRQLLMGLFSVMLVASLLTAQDNPPAEQPQPQPERRERGPDGERGERRGRNIDPEQRREWMERARERMNEQMKERLSATDEEWGVIQPRLEKVMTSRLRGVSFGGFRGGPGSPGGEGDSERQLSDVEVKSRALREAIDAEADAEKLKQAMTELREARAKQAEETKKAADELREVLSLRQEAVLVSMSILE